MLSAVKMPSTMPAPMSVMRIASGSPIIHPNTPPASLSAGSPSRGCGRSPPMWQKPATEMTKSAKPMPMRPLSCTDAGCRKSQPARSRSRTGITNASLPTSPPAVYALMVCATSLPMKNHSLTAPAIANSTIRNGSPSRRWSFSSVSGPNARKSPPVPWASPIQARTISGGLSTSPTYRFGAGAGLAARDEDPFAGARPFLVGLELLAMPPRYGGRP